MNRGIKEFIERQATPAPYQDIHAEDIQRARDRVAKLESEAKAAQEKAELEEKQRQATLTQAAKNIETPSTVNMFDSDYKVAQRMAEYLRDNIDEMSATPEGMREFNALSNQLTQFVQEGEEYYKTYYGTPEDEMSGNTWMSAFKRMNDPSNPYQKDGMMDSRSREMYEQTLRDLDDAGAYDFEVSGGNFIIKKGEKSMGVGDFQRPKDPFAAALEPTPAMSGQDFYVSRMPRNIGSREEAHMTAGALIRQDQRSQMDAARIYAEENDLNYKEVMNNPAQMQEAIDSYVESVTDSWSTASQAKERSKKSEKKAKKEKPTELQEIMADSSFTVEVGKPDYVATNDPEMPYRIEEPKSAILTWPSANRIPVSLSGGDTAYISNVRFNGTEYVAVLSDGQEIVVSPQLASDGSVSANPAYAEIARQVDSELGEEGAFKRILDQLHTKQSS